MQAEENAGIVSFNGANQGFQIKAGDVAPPCMAKMHIFAVTRPHR